MGVFVSLTWFIFCSTLEYVSGSRSLNLYKLSLCSIILMYIHMRGPGSKQSLNALIHTGHVSNRQISRGISWALSPRVDPSML